jgi:hypothetical protein
MNDTVFSVHMEQTILSSMHYSACRIQNVLVSLLSETDVKILCFQMLSLLHAHDMLQNSVTIQKTQLTVYMMFTSRKSEPEKITNILLK